VANCLIHTLGGLYDSAGRLLHGGLVAELVQALTDADPATQRRRLGRTWVLNVCPDRYRDLLERWLVEEPRLRLLTGTRVVGLAADGCEIAEVIAVRHGQEMRMRPRVVIDATGSADVVRQFDLALIQDHDPAVAGGLILRLRGVVPAALDFPRGVAVVHALRGAAADGALPADCARAWLDRGVYPDEAYLKLFVPLPAEWRQQREAIVQDARRSGEAVVQFLRGRREFAHARVERIGTLGIRDGGRVEGEYRLTADDVRRGRKFDDAACRCAWPIEFWDGERGVSLEYLPEDTFYEIPLRALKVRGVTNLWAVGKCLSADSYAQASARIAGCCWAMGQAVGEAVARGVTACP
jgi:hypothetical protein